MRRITVFPFLSLVLLGITAAAPGAVSSAPHSVSRRACEEAIDLVYLLTGVADGGGAGPAGAGVPSLRLASSIEGVHTLTGALQSAARFTQDVDNPDRYEVEVWEPYQGWIRVGWAVEGHNGSVTVWSDDDDIHTYVVFTPAGSAGWTWVAYNGSGQPLGRGTMS